MLYITPTLAIDENNIQLHFVRSQGPGGQNVNKIATAAQLRFDINSLPEAIKQRLQQIAGKRITTQGELIINAQRFRSQEKNRQDAINRLIELLRQAAIKPKRRHKTKPTAAAKHKRLEKKKRRGKIKNLRKKVFD
jgi:ribosome-associated protein